MGHYIPEERTQKFYRNDEPLSCPVCSQSYTDITVYGPMTEVHDTVTDQTMWMPAKVLLPCGHELPLPPPEVPSVPTQ